MGLHPEIPLVALAGLVHRRIAGLLLVLGRGRRGDDGGIHDGSLAHQQTALRQQRPDLIEQCLGQIMLLQPVAELQQRRRVRHRVAGSGQYRQSPAKPGCRTAHLPTPRPPARAIAAQSKSAASAPAQSAAGRAHPSGRAAADAPPAAPGACPGEGRGHHQFHLGQKLVATRLLLLAGVLNLRKAALTLHRPAPGPQRTSKFYSMPNHASRLISVFP